MCFFVVQVCYGASWWLQWSPWVSRGQTPSSICSQVRLNPFLNVLFHLNQQICSTWPASPFYTGSGLQSDCAGNLMRLSLDKALAVGSQLEVEAISEYRTSMIKMSGWPWQSICYYDPCCVFLLPLLLQMAPSTLCWHPAWLLSVDTAWSLTHGATPESTPLWWAAMWTTKYFFPPVNYELDSLYIYIT